MYENGTAVLLQQSVSVHMPCVKLSKCPSVQTVSGVEK